MTKSLLITFGVVLLFANSALATVLFQDNFDGYSDSPNNHGWSISAPITFPSTEGCNGSRGARVPYLAAGTGSYWFRWPGIAEHNRGEIYVRFYAKAQPDNGGMKFMKFFGKQDGTGYANTTFPLEAGGNFLGARYGDGSGTANDTQAFVFMKGNKTDPDVVINTQTSSFVPDNQWHCFEFFMKYNTNDQRDGIYKIWIDGTLRLDATNVKNRHNLNTRALESIDFANYTATTTSVERPIWYDNFVVSDSYIGTLDEPLNDEPILTNLLPDAELIAGTTSTTLGVTSDESATCKYGPVDLTYSQLPNTFSGGPLIHTALLTELYDGYSQDYHIKCKKTVAGTENTNDTVVSVRVAEDFRNVAVFEWSSATYTVSESAGTAVVGRINRSHNSSGTASVLWQTLGITADGAADYVGIMPTQVDFADGETYKDVSLQILSDALVEGDETTEILLSSPTNAVLGPLSSAILTITEDVSLSDAGCLSECDAGLADALVADTHGIDVEVQDAGQTGDDVVLADVLVDDVNTVDVASADANLEQMDAGVGSDCASSDGLAGDDTNVPEVVDSGCGCRSVNQPNSGQWLIVLGMFMLWGRRRRLRALRTTRARKYAKLL